MRLELVLLPDAMDRVFAYTLLMRQSASAPVRRPLRFGLERRFDNASHVGLAIKRFPSSTWRDVPNRTDSVFTNAAPPQSCRASLQLQFSGDLLIRLPLAGPEND